MDARPNQNSVIEKSPGQDHALDFDFLRAKGIELIQQYGGKNWTDFNIHDPGITMLEYVCYALTDIAYRTTFPITDILADENGHINRSQNFFFAKEEILSSGPVTINDYRKFLIDRLPEVDNIWLEPVKSKFSSNYSKGVYNVIIKPDPAFIDPSAADDEETIRQLIQKVKNKLLKHRNIGGNYESFKVLKRRAVYLKGDIIISKDASPEILLAKIYDTLEKTLNPTVRFYTEAEMLAKGFAIENIYNGPLLKKGILPDSELRERVTVIDPLILTKVISALEGVVSVKHLQLSFDGLDYHTDALQFDDLYFPYMKIDDLNPNISLYHDNYKLYIPRLDILKREQKSKRHLIGSAVQKKKIPDLKGEYKNLENYVSIQALFPAIYGISKEGPMTGSNPEALSKIRQLKAYLMLFEQLLANSLSQLARISELFSTDIETTSGATYHFQPLYNVPDVKYLLKAFTDKNDTASDTDWNDFKNDANNGFVLKMRDFIETDEQYKDRKKRAFDHMLSRFNITAHQQPVFLYEFYYERQNHYKRIDLEIKWKAAMLNNLHAFTTNRIKADIFETLDEDEGLESGFGHKMALLLHIKNPSRRRLSEIIEGHSNSINMEPTDTIAHEAVNETVLKWRKEELSIITNPEVFDIENDSPEALSSSITFKRQTELLFQSAIVFKNYRIIPYPAPDSITTAILFKHPNDIKWSIVSIHADEYEALIALKKITRLFKEISIESEGFYLLEHLLLKPAFESRQYGFTFNDQHNKAMIEQHTWQSFAEREQTIADLLDTAKSYTPRNYEKTVARLMALCRFNAYWLKENKDLHNDGQPNKEGITELLYNLQQFDPENTDFYPCFNYRIKQTNGKVVAEDFYNFRMTVVFPSWPARFQDASFRVLADKIFKEECPAHMKISLLWLPLSQMKKFDGLYFDWLEALKTDAGSAAAHDLSLLLSQFLITGKAAADDEVSDQPDDEQTNADS